MRMLLAAALLVCGSSAAPAADWGRYGNARFGYWIDIPPGFTDVVEAANGDGGISTLPDGNAELRIWGGHLTEGDFPSEVRWRIERDKSDGWDISYERTTSQWASWSGRRNNRIVYARAIQLCGDQAAYFRIEYYRSDLERFGAVVERLVASLQPGSECR